MANEGDGVTSESPEQADEGRRGLLGVVLGAFGLATLSACSGRSEEEVAGAAQALAGGGFDVGAGGTVAGLVWADTVNALRTLSGSANAIAILHAYATPNDGGGGLFVWSDVAKPDNDGTVLNAASATTSGWRRIYSGPINVRWFGAKGDWNGTSGTDDAPAIRSAIAAATAGSGAGTGAVFFPAGAYRVGSTIRISRAVTLLGVAGAPPGGTSAQPTDLPTIVHHFTGDLFEFDGAAGGPHNSGGGIEGLRLVQANGPPGTYQGRAIYIHGIDSDHRPAWLRFLRLTIEESTGGMWDWAIAVDGASFGIPDLYFGEISTHTSGASKGAVELKGALAPVFFNCTFYIEGHVEVTGNPPNSVRTGSAQFVNVSGGVLRLNYCSDTTLIGGIWTQISTTANVAGSNTLLPGRLTTPFQAADASIASPTGAIWFEPNGVGVVNSRWRLSRPPVLENAHSVYGRTYAGTDVVPLIGCGSSLDIVKINADQTRMVTFGNVTNVTGASAGDIVLMHGVSIRAMDSAGASTNVFLRTAPGDDILRIGEGWAGGMRLGSASDKVGFFGSPPISRPTVTGALAGAPTLAQLTAVVQRLVAALGDKGSGLGIVHDTTT